jgi:hypothetical protein
MGTTSSYRRAQKNGSRHKGRGREPLELTERATRLIPYTASNSTGWCPLRASVAFPTLNGAECTAAKVAVRVQVLDDRFHHFPMTRTSSQEDQLSHPNLYGGSGMHGLRLQGHERGKSTSPVILSLSPRRSRKIFLDRSNFREPVSWTEKVMPLRRKSPLKEEASSSTLACAACSLKRSQPLRKCIHAPACVGCEFASIVIDVPISRAHIDIRRLPRKAGRCQTSTGNSAQSSGSHAAVAVCRAYHCNTTGSRGLA